MINKIKSAFKEMNFKMLFLWLSLWCPLFLLYWLCGFFVYIQGMIADIMNKLDDYIMRLK